MPIVLYYAAASAPCRTVQMAAREFGVDVKTVDVNLMAGEQLKPDFIKMNPQHCIPTIDDNGFYLWESRAIITYLANKYAPDNSLYPKDPQKRALVDRVLYFDIGTLYKAQAEYVYPQLFKGEAPNPEKEALYKKALDLFELQLKQTEYAAGNERTLADLSILAGFAFNEVLVGYDYSTYPKIAAWLKKLKAELPYYEELNDKPLKAFKEMLKSLPKPSS